MQETEWIWHKGEFVKWHDAQVHVLTHALHYGSGVFEGIRAYETDKGPAVFRLKEHMDRLIYSSKVLQMNVPYSVDELCDISVELIRRNKLQHCYIRPLAYFDYGVMGLNPRDSKTAVSIACWPWGAYLPHETVDIKTSSYIRIHPKSTVPDAKICGHYVNSILAVLELKGTKYHEALFCDDKGNVLEGPGENLFLLKDGKIHTPSLGGILAGITRATLIQLAKDQGIEVIERVIKHEEIFSADEAFFTGTAAEVTPIGTLDDRKIGDGGVGKITRTLRDLYLGIVQGKVAKYESYLTYA